jgi:hypothetical protein
MKKYFIALLFGLSVLSMQIATAATMTLTNLSAGDVTTGTGSTVAGTGNGDALLGILPFSISSWKLDVDSSASLDFNLSGGLAFSTSLFDNPTFMPPPKFSFVGATGTTMLDAGSYYISVFSGFGNVGTPYDLSITPSAVSAVPLPAAVWLFGSALLGVVGVTTRKSQAKLAA